MAIVPILYADAMFDDGNVNVFDDAAVTRYVPFKLPKLVDVPAPVFKG